MTETTPQQRAEWAALAEAATPGPWEAVQGASAGWWVEQPNTATIADIDIDYSGQPDADAAFIAAAREAVPALLADLEAVEAALEAGDACGAVGCRALAERDRLRAGIEALADRYGADAAHEGYGGELWSTTEAALRALLAEGGSDV
jgi:hypothetical protein